MSLHWKVRQGEYVSWAEKPVWRGQSVSLKTDVSSEQSWNGVRFGPEAFAVSLSHTLCTHTHTCICITSSHHLASGRGDEQVSRSLRRVTASLRTARSTFKSTRKRFCVYCKLIFARNYCLDWKHQQYSLLMYGSQTRCFEAYFLLIRSQTFVNAVRNLFRVKLMRQTWWFIKILIIIIIIIRFFRLCN